MNNTSTLTENSESSPNETHLHKMLTISAKVERIDYISGSKLGKITFEESPNESFYFFTGTLKNENTLIGNKITFGMLDFFIGENFKEPAFNGGEGRGIIIFNISNDELALRSIVAENRSITFRNFIAKPSEPTLTAGTRACAPCKFLDSQNRMIRYELGTCYYYPMVTFADEKNPLSSCYLSFFKCDIEQSNQIEGKATSTYIYSVDDYPRIDDDGGVLVHEEVY